MLAAPACAGSPPGGTVSPLDFGAVGDGRTDDTAAFNRAAEAARRNRGELVIPTTRTFAIGGLVEIRNGVRAVRARGARLRLISSRQPVAGIVLLGREGGSADNVHDCIVEGLYIDCEGRPALAIYGQNPVNCTIQGNEIVNCRRGNGILLRAFARGGEAAGGNRVADNRVEGSGNAQEAGIAVDAQLTGGDAIASWRQGRVLAPAGPGATNNQIVNNTVTGFLYGIGLSGSSNNLLADNVLRGQARGISLQNNSSGNRLERNQAADFTSSAVHLAYGSSNNVVSQTSARSQVASGEGVIQAYVGSGDNQFFDNDILISGRSPAYHLYAAVDSGGCHFEGNRLAGAAARAYLAVESNWMPAPGNAASRTHGFADFPGFGFARGDMRNVALLRNRIEGSSSAAAIAILQNAGRDRGQNIDALRVEGNVVRGTGYRAQLIIAERGGLVSNVACIDNVFDPLAASRAFVLPRGRAHFAVARGNGNALGALIGEG